MKFKSVSTTVPTPIYLTGLVLSLRLTACLGANIGGIVTGVHNPSGDSSHFHPGVPSKGGWSPIPHHSGLEAALERKPKQSWQTPNTYEPDQDSQEFHYWDGAQLVNARTLPQIQNVNQNQAYGQKTTPRGRTKPRGNRGQLKLSRFPPQNLLRGLRKRPSPSSHGRPNNHSAQPSGPTGTAGQGKRPQNGSFFQTMARRWRTAVDSMMSGLFGGLFQKRMPAPRRRPRRPSSTRRPPTNPGPDPAFRVAAPFNSYAAPSANLVQSSRPSQSVNSFQPPPPNQSGWTIPGSTLSTAPVASNSYILAPSGSNPWPNFGATPGSFTHEGQSSSQAIPATSSFSAPATTFSAFSPLTSTAPIAPNTRNVNPFVTYSPIPSQSASFGSSVISPFTFSYISTGSSPISSPSSIHSSNSLSSDPFPRGVDSASFPPIPPRERHAPCFNCNKAQSLNRSPPSTVSGSTWGAQLSREIRGEDLKRKEMFDIRMAWYHYQQKVQDFEAKYHSGEREALRRFKKEIANATSTTTPVHLSFLVGLKSPQLVEEDASTSESASQPQTSNLFAAPALATGKGYGQDSSSLPSTIQATFVNSLPQTILDPHQGVIGPGYSQTANPIYPQELEVFTPPPTPTTNPFTRKPEVYRQTRPKAFHSKSALSNNDPQSVVNGIVIEELFDHEAALSQKYKKILTPASNQPPVFQSSEVGN